MTPLFKAEIIDISLMWSVEVVRTVWTSLLIGQGRPRSSRLFESADR